MEAVEFFFSPTEKRLWEIITNSFPWPECRKTKNVNIGFSSGGRELNLYSRMAPVLLL